MENVPNLVIESSVSSVELISFIVLILWNLITFAMMGIDKSRARNHKRRISEKTLITTAFLMGGVGAFFGMQVFRHKTKHLKFQILIPVSILLNLGVIWLAAIAIPKLLV